MKRNRNLILLDSFASLVHDRVARGSGKENERRTAVDKMIMAAVVLMAAISPARAEEETGYCLSVRVEQAVPAEFTHWHLTWEQDGRTVTWQAPAREWSEELCFSGSKTPEFKVWYAHRDYRKPAGVMPSLTLWGSGDEAVLAYIYKKGEGGREIKDFSVLLRWRAVLPEEPAQGEEK